MKIIWTCIVLLSCIQYAFADITLTFQQLLDQSNTPSITYSIKDPQLKLVEFGQNKTNVYNRKTEEFISFEPVSGTTSRLNETLLNKQTNQLNIKRMQSLAEVEENLRKKIPDMTPAQQEATETLINLFKYPQFYGEHNSLILRKLEQTKQVGDLQCQPYELYKLDKLVTFFCLANEKSLKMSAADYQTLRRFYAFNYHVQSSLYIAGGNTKFTIIDYDQHNMPGVVIEEIKYRASATGKPEVIHHSKLKSVDHQAIKDTEFELIRTP